MSEEKILYKYRSWSNAYHRDILHFNEVYMARPGDFNDPFDAQIPKNHLLLDTDEKRKKYVFEKLREIEPRSDPKSSEFVEKFRVGLERLSNLEEYQKMYEELYLSEEDKRVGLISFSMRWNSILMWSHYGDMHKGFNVGFHMDAMNDSKLFGKGGPVSYEEEFPQIEPKGKMDREEFMKESFRRTNTKALEWEYEEEYRLEIFGQKELSMDDRIIRIPSECFAEINLGIKFPKSEAKKVLEIADVKSIPVYQLEKVPFKFELDRVRIN